MPDSYQLEWYASRGRELGASGRCPYANVHSCPRYWESLSLLGDAGIATSIDKQTDARLEQKWKGSKLWPVVAENATAVANRNSFSNFCPEVSFNVFRNFASSLSRYSDEIDRDAAHALLEREADVTPNDWRWQWANVTPLHFGECPLYSQIRISQEPEEPHAGEVVTMKPGVLGFSIDVKVLLDRLARSWLKARRKKAKP